MTRARASAPRSRRKKPGAPEGSAPPAGPEVPGFTRRATAVSLAVILGLGLLLRLAHFAAIAGTPFPDFPRTFTESDMNTFLRWAEQILAGDVLGRNTYHPDFEWMRRIAPLETWYRWWGGPATFQQAPFYPYWVAALLAVSGRSLTFVLLVQLVVGAVQPLVLFVLGRRFWNARVGLVAAALAAVYGPLIFFQGTLLRDWLPPLLEPLGLFLLVRARGTGRARDFGLAGATLGVALLVRESLLLFLPLALAWVLWEHWPPSRRTAVVAACFLAGLVVSLSPLVARNVEVGAPALALSNRAAEGFILGNAADGFPVANFRPGSMKTILEQTDGRFFAVVRNTLATGDSRRFVRLQLLKLRGLADPLEVPDNLAWSYGLDISPVLPWTLRYGLILPLGLAGLLLVFSDWRQHLLLAVYGLSIVGGLLFSIVHARYRLPLVPVLIVYGAAGIVAAADAFRARQPGRGYGWLGALVVLLLVQHLLVPLPELRARPGFVFRPQEYLLAAERYAEAGRFERAIVEMERLRARAIESPDGARLAAGTAMNAGDYRIDWARKLLAEGRRDDARRQVHLAAAAYAPYSQLSHGHFNLGIAYLALDEPARARAALKQFLALEPSGARADQVRRLLGCPAPADSPGEQAVPSGAGGGADQCGTDPGRPRGE